MFTIKSQQNANFACFCSKKQTQFVKIAVNCDIVALKIAGTGTLIHKLKKLAYNIFEIWILQYMVKG